MKYLYIIASIFFLIKAQGQKTEGSFMPESGKYIISGWVKEDQVSKQPSSYTDSSIKVAIADGQNTPIYSVQIKPSGTIIDGWQRLSGIIEIPLINTLTLPNIKIELICSGTSYDCYFDDIRFYPYNGNIKSFVYAEDTQRLMAELDENNYATFYEYDLEGGLIRVKKETERGVMTIQETRSNTIKR